ncbi:MAG: Asp-tRNA(Asn)/Glu-tRNA(Gln) amidotransferase subunit GatC [Candidatus Aenigmatarchaeota archaeon]
MPKPKITPADVKHVAEISRLSLSSKELKAMQKDLTDILSMFKDLDKLSVGKTKPSFQPIPIKDVFREDIVKESLSQEKALANTKHKENGFFKGPSSL